MKRLLTGKTPSGGRYNLEIKATSLADAVSDRESEDSIVGVMEVRRERGREGRKNGKKGQVKE